MILQLLYHIKETIILGCNTMVQSSWSITKHTTLWLPYWCLVHRMYICRNGTRKAIISRRFRNWSIISYFQVIWIFYIVITRKIWIYNKCSDCSTIMLEQWHYLPVLPFQIFSTVFFIVILCFLLSYLYFVKSVFCNTAWYLLIFFLHILNYSILLVKLYNI